MKKLISMICVLMLAVGCQSDSTKSKDVAINNQAEQIVEKDSQQTQTDNQKESSPKEKEKQNKENNEVKKNKKEDNAKSTSSTSKQTSTTSKGKKSDNSKTSSSSQKPSNQSDKNNQAENTNKKPSKPNNDDNKDKEEKPHKHMFAVNGGWFQTQTQAEARFDEEINKWDQKLNNKEITWEEYGQKCPCGYEIFRCTCGMHGLNLSYER